MNKVIHHNDHLITQHFTDALGRETNTVIRPANVEGAAVDANFVYAKGWRTSETTAYLDGASDSSVHTDARGVRTFSRSNATKTGTSIRRKFPTPPIS